MIDPLENASGAASLACSPHSCAVGDVDSPVQRSSPTCDILIFCRHASTAEIRKGIRGSAHFSRGVEGDRAPLRRRPGTGRHGICFAGCGGTHDSIKDTTIMIQKLKLSFRRNGKSKMS